MFEQVRVTIRGADGKVRTPCMLLARTEATRAEGLMHVHASKLDPYAGMVFAFDDDVTGSFTMDHTLIPLTVIFFDRDGTGVGSKSMIPCPTGVHCRTYGSPKPYRWAIEVPTDRLDASDLSAEPSAVKIDVGGACHTP
jgi:uncharacterized membrane protein (UPF0127 family)